MSYCIIIVSAWLMSLQGLDSLPTGTSVTPHSNQSAEVCFQARPIYWRHWM